MIDFEKAKQFFIEGIKAVEKKDFQDAENQFARSLELIPDRVSTLNNLSAIKNRLKKFQEAEALARKAVGLECTSREAWLNLGLALGNLNNLEGCENLKETLRACESALKLNSSQYEVLYAKSLILAGLKQAEEAKATYQKAIETRAASSPTFTTERRASQKAEVLVVNQNPAFNTALKPFEALHLDANFPGQLARILNEDYHFTYVFKSGVISRTIRQQIPKPDFIINNNASGESLLTADGLSEFIEALESFGVPIVNHPDQVIQTTRDASVRCLMDIPGILLPKTERFCSTGKSREALVREIEKQYNYPLITRTLTAQEGKGMTRVDSRAAVSAVLDSDFAENFFVTAFVDSRHGNPFYRKIRAAFVKDDFTIVRVDYDTNWNVHGRKSDERVKFYLENSSLLAREKQICADPENTLGSSAIQSLRAMRGRIPLDIFGVDFDVDADGRLVFYEANASMNLFSTAREEVPHPSSADDALTLAIQRYFTSLTARR